MKKPETVKDIIDAVDTTALIARPLSDWRPILSQECQVYVFGENYIAKRFDTINYKFCEKIEAKEILVDNLYALLRYKYFPKTSEEIDDRINKIVTSFTANLKTTLRKISFDTHSDADIVKMIPDSCIAFRNGVFDFAKNDWLFKYDIIKLERISNTIYLYDPSYVIMWYLDYDFESLGIDILHTPLNDFIDIMKDFTKAPGTRNYCFELMYNISHDNSDKFSYERFVHLCEILGYTTLQSFSQFFVLLIGSGQNGKNSLFDGCFTNRVIPRSASNDLDSIENDRFITGALENRCHNIFLETSAKTYTESKMLKALTGSMYQTIEQKGISKYSGVINCKYLFAGNDQDKIKFSDNTTGFRRRINMFEIFYQWDSAKKFLKRGDYFDTTFSDSLAELKDDPLNTTAYVYFSMYGIMNATKNFTKNFQFTYNDWNSKYTDADLDVKEKIDAIDNVKILEYVNTNDKTHDDGKTMFFDVLKKRLYMSDGMSDLGVKSYDEMLEFFKDPALFMSYFAEHDVYMSVRSIQAIIKDLSPSTGFTQMLKKLYMLSSLEYIGANKAYVKVTFVKNRLRIIK